MAARKAIRCTAVSSALAVGFLTPGSLCLNLDGRSGDVAIVLWARPWLVPQDTTGQIVAAGTEKRGDSRWDAVVANSSNDIEVVDSVPAGPKSYGAKQMPESSVSEYTTNFDPPTIRTPKAENAR